MFWYPSVRFLLLPIFTGGKWNFVRGAVVITVKKLNNSIDMFGQLILLSNLNKYECQTFVSTSYSVFETG